MKTDLATTGNNQRPLVWLHGGSLSNTDPAMANNPTAPAIFVFDREFLSQQAIAFARLQFIFEAALEALAGRESRIAVGVQAVEIAAFAEQHNCNCIHTTAIASPELDKTIKALEELGFSVVLSIPARLTSFSGTAKRFRKQVEREVWQ
jgi:hypothetical protein